MSIFSTQMFPQVLLIIPMYLVITTLRLLDTVLGVVLGQIILVLPFQIWMLTGYFNNITAGSTTRPASTAATSANERLLYIVLPIARRVSPSPPFSPLSSLGATT